MLSRLYSLLVKIIEFRYFTYIVCGILVSGLIYLTYLLYPISIAHILLEQPEKSLSYIKVILATMLIIIAMCYMMTDISKQFKLTVRLLKWMIPSLLFSIFIYALVINFILQAYNEVWSSTKVKDAFDLSSKLAEKYLNEHISNVKGDILSIATHLDRQSYDLSFDGDKINEFLEGEALNRDLVYITIFTKTGDIVAHAGAVTSKNGETVKRTLKEADNGEIFVLPDNNDAVRAIIKLHNYPNCYILVSKFIDSEIASYVSNAQGAMRVYGEFTKQAKIVNRNTLAVIAALSSIMCIIQIITVSLISKRITLPILQLSETTEKVAGGDWSARSIIPRTNDEITILAKNFNQMIETVQEQRGELSAKKDQLSMMNDVLQERNCFIEAVFKSVSAGIISFDQNLKLSLYNQSLLDLLEIKDNYIEQTHIPDFITALAMQVLHEQKTIMQQAEYIANHKKKVFHLRAQAEMNNTTFKGVVITIDDITAIISAQRKSAWSDVAKRVAHEIKNPLTPISLAASMMRIKYAKNIPENDRESFEKYIKTIINYVEEINKMVVEFVDFARMPTPQMTNFDVIMLINDIIFAEKQVDKTILYSFINQTDRMKVEIEADKGQIGRVLQNLLKNAREAFFLDKIVEKKKIAVTLGLEKSYIYMMISDNAGGFPPNIIHQLAEPYMTTKEHGTGLGLAISKRIIEEHQGKMSFYNNETQACVEITLPLI